MENLKINSEKRDKGISIIESPKICCIDLNEEIIFALEKTGANIYNGTLGSKINVPNDEFNDHQLLSNYNFPSNLQEYDIIIIDLDNSKTIDFNQEEHIRKSHTGKSSYHISSCFPETLFDPRPLSCKTLNNFIQQIKDRNFLVIAFSSEDYNVDYQILKITERKVEKLPLKRFNIYSFWDDVPTSEPRFGKEFKIHNLKNNLQKILEKFKDGTYYNQTFTIPKKFTNYEMVDDENYLPLMTSLNGEIVSFLVINEKKSLIILPQIKDKVNFLLEFLSEVAPLMYPELFPFSTTFNWKEQYEYWLPNHYKLLEEKNDIIKEYEKKIEENKKNIEKNQIRFSFLHNIIIETGDSLVDSLIQFLKWLEFENVKDFDNSKSNSSILEEDIQVTLHEGLLIIECKGIGGTSTDSDCNQISNIKHRRCKERNSFDVFALYIVNHQRYLPPLKRQNPPFTPQQIQDAVNDERGLLTTWQLFDLYYNIAKEIITKEEARKSLLEFGLIDLRPKNLLYIYEPTEILKDGKVCIIKIENILLKINDELLIEKNNLFEKAIILEIQNDGKQVNQCTNGEYGLKLSSKVNKKSIIWKKAF